MQSSSVTRATLAIGAVGERPHRASSNLTGGVDRRSRPLRRRAGSATSGAATANGSGESTGPTSAAGDRAAVATTASGRQAIAVAIDHRVSADTTVAAVARRAGASGATLTARGPCRAGPGGSGLATGSAGTGLARGAVSAVATAATNGGARRRSTRAASAHATDTGRTCLGVSTDTACTADAICTGSAGSTASGRESTGTTDAAVASVAAITGRARICTSAIPASTADTTGATVLARGESADSKS
jgi:hypothetical protein